MMLSIFKLERAPQRCHWQAAALFSRTYIALAAAEQIVSDGPLCVFGLPSLHACDSGTLSEEGRLGNVRTASPVASRIAAWVPTSGALRQRSGARFQLRNLPSPRSPVVPRRLFKCLGLLLRMWFLPHSATDGFMLRILCMRVWKHVMHRTNMMRCSVSISGLDMSRGRRRKG